MHERQRCSLSQLAAGNINYIVKKILPCESPKISNLAPNADRRKRDFQAGLTIHRAVATNLDARHPGFFAAAFSPNPSSTNSCSVCMPNRSNGRQIQRGPSCGSYFVVSVTAVLVLDSGLNSKLPLTKCTE